MAKLIINMSAILHFMRRVYRRLKPKQQRFQSKITIADSDDNFNRYSPSWVHLELARNIKPKNSFHGEVIVDDWQTSARKSLRMLIGEIEVSPINSVTPVWSANDDRGTYEKIVITGEFGSKIPLYKCIPSHVEPPYSWVICLQGHNSGMHNSLGVDNVEEKWKYKVDKSNDFVNWCFSNGFAALCLEQSCFGERGENSQVKRSQHWCHDAALHSLLLGRTIMGERLADVERAIRYIDQALTGSYKNIGVMGHSLGGTVSIYSGALIKDVDFVVAGSCVSSFDESLLRIYHCADLYIPRLREYFEFGDIVGLMAPKPLVIVQGNRDPIFPLSGFKSAEKVFRSIYRKLGAVDRLQVSIGDGGHRFYAELATQAIDKMRDQVSAF